MQVYNMSSKDMHTDSIITQGRAIESERTQTLNPQKIKKTSLKQQ